MAAETKEELLFLINLCDTSKCFNEMVDAVKKLVSICPELSYEERYLLWVAFKGAMSSIRQPWRAIWFSRSLVTKETGTFVISDLENL
ncbi:hypothetical protein niasHT_027321 [Heterodera trifolii]|uniref:14-3-3 domain-containing protein n=1 Tax=Heterodera trifolii TaxID=157864 RepID=A0ABD2JTS7_9BILA